MSVSSKNFRYGVHEILHFFSNLSHFNPFPNLTLYFFKIAYNICSNLRILSAVSKSGPSGM